MSDEVIFVSDKDIKETEFFHAFRLIGVSFTVAIVFLILSFTNFITYQHSLFLCSIFSVSVLFAFPIEALVEFIRKKPFSIKNNVFTVILMSFLVFFIFNFQDHLMQNLMAYLIGIPVLLLTIIIYLLLFEYMPKPKMDVEKNKIYYLVFCAIPTIIIVFIIFSLIMLVFPNIPKPIININTSAFTPPSFEL